MKRLRGTTLSAGIAARREQDVERSRSALRRMLSAFTNVYKDPEAPVETRHLKLYSGYLQKLRPEHEALMTEKIMRATTLVGTKDQVIDSIRQMQAAGVHQVAVQPILDTDATIDQFADEIMPAFR